MSGDGRDKGEWSSMSFINAITGFKSKMYTFVICCKVI